MTNQDIQLLRVLVFEEELGEEKMFVAQCLEKNIGAQGKDLDELFERLSATIFLEIPYMDRISPAPDKYFSMWKEGEMLSDNLLNQVAMKERLNHLDIFHRVYRRLFKVAMKEKMNHLVDVRMNHLVDVRLVA